MRMLFEIDIPNEPFNTYAKEGSAGQRLGRILEETRPETVYFTERDGGRGAVAVYDLEASSGVPALAEPWFLQFDASVRFRVLMTPEDLKNAGLDAIAKKWSS